MDGKVYPDQESAARAARAALVAADMRPIPGETFEVEESDAGWWWFCPLPDFPGSRAKALMGEAAVEALEGLLHAGLLESALDGVQRATARMKAKRVLRAAGVIKG